MSRSHPAAAAAAGAAPRSVTESSVLDRDALAAIDRSMAAVQRTNWDARVEMAEASAGERVLAPSTARVPVRYIEALQRRFSNRERKQQQPQQPHDVSSEEDDASEEKDDAVGALSGLEWSGMRRKGVASEREWEGMHAPAQMMSRGTNTALAAGTWEDGIIWDGDEAQRLNVEPPTLALPACDTSLLLKPKRGAENPESAAAERPAVSVAFGGGAPHLDRQSSAGEDPSVAEKEMLNAKCRAPTHAKAARALSYVAYELSARKLDCFHHPGRAWRPMRVDRGKCEYPEAPHHNIRVPEWYEGEGAHRPSWTVRSNARQREATAAASAAATARLLEEEDNDDGELRSPFDAEGALSTRDGDIALVEYVHRFESFECSGASQAVALLARPLLLLPSGPPAAAAASPPQGALVLIIIPLRALPLPLPPPAAGTLRRSRFCCQITAWRRASAPSCAATTRCRSLWSAAQRVPSRGRVK